MLARIVGGCLFLFWLLWLFWVFTDEPPDSGLVNQFGGSPQVVGYVAAPELREMSGLVASQQHPECFWTHNDSGDDSFFYLIARSGRLLATYQLQAITAYDWEEIALARIQGKPMLFIADIGDNRARRKSIRIHILSEPADCRSHRIPRAEVATLKLSYPDGARDAEAMLIDVAHNELIIITKRERNARVYTTPLLPLKSRKAMLTFQGILPLNMVTAASLSPDGREVLVKNYEQIFYWKRQGLQQPLRDLLQALPQRIGYLPEPQGEAIAWATDGAGFYTTSERPFFMGAPLVFYRR